MLTRTLLIAALLASAGMANAQDVGNRADTSRGHEWQGSYVVGSGTHVVGSGYTGFTSELVASSEDFKDRNSQRIGPYDMVSRNEIQQRRGYGLDTLEQRG